MKQVTNTIRSRFPLHPLVLDLGLTAATEFAVVVMGLFVVSLFGRDLGAAALGEYLLLRRVYAWLQPISRLGLGGALTRYVAYAEDKPASERSAYFLAAATCASAVAFSLGIVLNVAREPFARWLFGSIQMRHLVLPLSLLLIGGTAQTMVYGYYRGRLAMKWANALQFGTLALIPLGAAVGLVHTGSVALIMNVVGVSMLVCSLVFVTPILPQLEVGTPKSFRWHAAELLRYGIPRLPAAFGLGALFALGPMIATHYLPVARVSYLLLGMSLLTGVSASAEPLGLILLSKVSTMLAQDRLAEVRIRLSYLQAAVLELYVFSCLQLIVFADVLIRGWVGSKFLEGIVIIRIVLVAIPFYLLFASLRTAIDAASVTAYNTLNIGVASLVFLLFAVVGVKMAPIHFLLESIAGALVAAVIVLAWLTNRTVRKLFGLRIDWSRSARPLWLSVLLAGTSLLFHWVTGFRAGLWQVLLLGLATGALYLGLLRKLRSQWLSFFWNMAFLREARIEAVGNQSG